MINRPFILSIIQMFFLSAVFIQHTYSQIAAFNEISFESSLILYMNPLDDISISVLNLSTYFSTWTPLKYLSLKVDVNNQNSTIKTYGPFESKNNLCGINMMKNYVLNYYYDGQEPIKFALLFSKDFDSINDQLIIQEYQFPIFSNFKSQKDLNDFGDFIYPDSIKLRFVAIIMPVITFVLLIVLSFACIGLKCYCCRIYEYSFDESIVDQL